MVSETIQKTRNSFTKLSDTFGGGATPIHYFRYELWYTRTHLAMLPIMFLIVI